jgi:CheY-like chemotaxis protein
MLEKQNFDLLITDIVMPVMDGVALALAVSEKWPQLPIIMMSGYPNERQRAYNLQDLITEVLSKPFTLNEFKAIVEQTLAQK